MNIGQHVEHLVTVRYGGVRAQTVPDLLGQDLEIYSRGPWRRGRCRGLVACRHNPVEWTKLTVAVSDVGQTPKVEDLAPSEGMAHDGELAREANTVVWGGAA
jgi:hypothetical protein